MNDPLDEQLDAEIDRLLAGGNGHRPASSATEQLARALVQLRADDRPALSPHGRVEGLETVRALAARKRSQRAGLFAALRSLTIPRWVQVAAIALIVVLLANGASLASAESLPGSPLYSIKRLTENSGLLLAPSNAARARLWMDLANRRLDEVQAIINQGRTVDSGTMDAVDESILRALTEIAGTRGAERAGLLQQLARVAIRQQTILDRMASLASGSERERFEQTRQLLAGVTNIANNAGGTNPATAPLPSTPTATPSSTPTPTSTASPAPSATLLPSDTSVPSAAPIIQPEGDASPGPTSSEAEAAPGSNGGSVGVSDGNVSPAKSENDGNAKTQPTATQDNSRDGGDQSQPTTQASDNSGGDGGPAAHPTSVQAPSRDGGDGGDGPAPKQTEKPQAHPTASKDHGD